MINLIKNELIKIFHKKAIYFIALITVILTTLMSTIIYISNNNDLFYSDENYYTSINSYLDSLDLNDASELLMYVEEKSYLDLYKLAKEFDDNSWQNYKIMDEGYQYIYDINEAEYISKDKILLEEAKNKYNTFINSIKNNNWDYFIRLEKNELEKRINELKLSLNNNELTDIQKVDIQKSIEYANIHLQGLNYRLEKEIPITDSDQSLLIEEFVNSGTTYLNYSKNEEDIIDHDELMVKREAEKSFFESKYMLDNDIPASSMFDANQLLLSDSTQAVTFIIVIIVVIAGSIVAEEYNKGTIKQLLLRPYSRTKILFSKFISSIIIFILFSIFYYFMAYLIYGLFFGFESYKLPIVVYSFVNNQILEVNLIKMILLNILSILPMYLIMIALAFFLSVLTGNSGVAIAVCYLIYIFENIITSLAITLEIKILRIFPTLCWNFSEYLFGGIPTYKYANFTLSVFICIITFLILFISSFLVFKYKDIKNQ